MNDINELRMQVLKYEKEIEILQSLVVYLNTERNISLDEADMKLIRKKLESYVDLQHPEMASMNAFLNVHGNTEVTGKSYACTQPNGTVQIATEKRKLKAGGKRR